MKPINKTSLAQKYGWTTNFLVKWINQHPALLNELIETGYIPKKDRIFTPKQIDIIYKYLGDPDKLL